MARANACLIPAPGHLSANRVEVGGVEGVRAGGTFGRRPPPPPLSEAHSRHGGWLGNTNSQISLQITSLSSQTCGGEVDLEKWFQLERKRICQHG